MASNAKWILLMAVLAIIMPEAAATARDVAAPAPMVVTVTVTLAARNEDNVLQWLEITAVPLMVFLVGACTWGLIENMALWKRLTGAEVESPNTPLERTTNSDPRYNRDARDLEIGLEITQRRNMDGEDPATTPALDLTVQHPALEAPQDVGKCAIFEGSVAVREFLEDINMYKWKDNFYGFIATRELDTTE